MKKNYSTNKVIKNIFSNTIYRSVFIISIISFLLLPFLGQKVIVPAFYNEMMNNIVDESKRVGMHIKKMGASSQYDNHYKMIKDDFIVEKIKVFDKDGYVTYSTDKKDIGTKNKNDYYYNKVAKGEIFYKVVHKGSKTLENRIVQRDVAEVYIPIMENGIFKGASEVYYDITSKRESFFALSNKIYWITFYISLTFLIVVFFLLFSASLGNLKRKGLQHQLEDLNKNLKTKVDEQTKELKDINQNLEQRIEEEIEKNREKDNKLFNQSKLASMGELIGNIAHQWRQPLSVVTTAISGIQIKQELGILEKGDLEDTFERILKNTDYLSRTITSFTHFFETDEEKQECKLDDIISNILNIVGVSLREKDIEVILDIEAIDLFISKNNFQQAVLNIINNAKDVLFSNKNLDKRYIFITSVKKGNILELYIKDNGGGIDKEIKDRIFEPYFTTKHQSQGTGIGLFMTKEIVEQNLFGIVESKNISFEKDLVQYNGAEFKISFRV